MPGLEEYPYNTHTTQSDLQIQGNFYQNSSVIFHRNKTNYPKFLCVETQKTTSTQSDLEKEQKC